MQHPALLHSRAVCRRHLADVQELRYFQLRRFTVRKIQFPNWETIFFLRVKVCSHNPDSESGSPGFNRSSVSSRAARLGGGPGRPDPGGVFPQQPEGGFPRADVPVGQPGQDEQSSQPVAQQEEETCLQWKEILPIEYIHVFCFHLVF